MMVTLVAVSGTASGTASNVMNAPVVAARLIAWSSASTASAATTVSSLGIVATTVIAPVLAADA